jgi:hypothetical protein
LIRPKWKPWLRNAIWKLTGYASVSFMLATALLWFLSMDFWATHSVGDLRSHFSPTDAKCSRLICPVRDFPTVPLTWIATLAAQHNGCRDFWTLRVSTNVT